MKNRYLGGLVLATAQLVMLSQATGQVVTDGSLGPGVALGGLNVVVGEALGTRAGSNLFHSFERFDIGPGGSATFTGAGDIQNVISRVTGGNVSNIQGLLRSEVGVADFYFINPAGIAITEGGSVDVPASFHLSTADELYFTDGSVLNLGNPTSGILSIASPEAFGFLGGGAGSIEVSDTMIVVSGVDQSSVDLDERMTLSAGDLVLRNNRTIMAPGYMGLVAVGDASVRYDLQTGAESVPNGDIDVSDVLLGIGPVSPTDYLRVEAANFTASDFSVVGADVVLDVDIADQLSLVLGSLETTSDNGNTSSGAIQITAGQLLIDGDGSGINAEGGVIATVDGQNAGDISISVEGLASIQNGGSITSGSTVITGNAGNLQLIAGELLIDGLEIGSGTGISSNTFGPGNAGGVEVTVEGLATIRNGGLVSSDTNAAGDAGNVKFTADRLLIDQGEVFLTGISSSTFGGSGSAGRVEVTIAEVASIQNSGEILSSTFGEGNAGSVLVTAGQLSIDQGGSRISSDSAISTSSAGNAGSVEVVIEGMVSIENGALISTNTIGGGDAGIVRITAGELLIDGRDDFGDSTGITSESNFSGGELGDGSGSSGDAGSVEVSVAGVASLLNGGHISSTVAFGDGDAGNVQVTSDRLLIDGQETRFGETGIFSTAEGDTGVGDAGSVEVVIAELATIQNAGLISTRTTGAGDAGVVRVTAGELLITGTGNSEGAFIDDRPSLAGNTGISSDTIGSGNAGSVEVAVTELATIQNGGRISSNSFAFVEGVAGDAGDVQVTARDLLINGQGSIPATVISSDTFGSGQAGSVEVFIAEVATIQHGGRISSDTTADGSAGVVRLTAGQLSIDGQDSEGNSGTGISSAARVIGTRLSTGNAGSVEVLVEGNIKLIDARIASAASGGASGAAGSVRVSADRLLAESNNRVINNVPGIFTDSGENLAGPVMVNTNSLILRNSQISTSTGSDTLDGGEVLIISEVMVLDSALIQANANSGQGGRISIDSAFIGSDNQVAIGGTERATFQFDGLNVIQAVAPAGVSVPPTINAPAIDVSGSLTQLNTAFYGAANLASDPCAAFIDGAPSTLTTMGRGGVPSGTTSALSFALNYELADQLGGERSPGGQPYYYSAPSVAKLQAVKPLCG